MVSGTPVYVAGSDGPPPPRVEAPPTTAGTISATPNTVSPAVTFTPGTVPLPTTTPTTAPGLLDGLFGGGG